MSFSEQVTLAGNDELIRKVQQALIKSAIAVAAESAETKSHDQRRSFAQAVLMEPQRWARLVVLGVVTNPSITAESKDNDIEFTVNSMWDAYAGVSEKLPAPVG